MKANKMSVRLLSVILTIALMFSIFSVSVFAEAESGTEEPVASGTESGEASGTEAPEASGTESGEASGTESGEASGTESGTPATSKPTESTPSSADAAAKKTKLIETIVSICIVVVTLVIVAIFCLIKKEKVAKFFRGLKSEMKKIVWLPFKQVRKNSFVVIVVVIIIAILVGVLDFAFSNGIKVLHGLFN